MKKTAVMFAACAAACMAMANPAWKDAAKPGAQSLVTDVEGAKVRVDALAENLFRVRMAKDGAWTQSGLNRYAILKSDWPAVKTLEKSRDALRTKAATLSVDRSATVRFKSAVSAADLAISLKLAGKGFEVRFPLAEGERVYGLGDVSRENIQRRPGRYEIWVKNVNSYIPIPMAVTSCGWGVLVNSTWRNYMDVGHTDKSALVASAPEGELDFYVFCGRDYRALLDIYTELSGRPQLLPLFGYGFTYVCNENVDMFRLLDEAREFRDRDLPCDVIGLEPGWMEKIYDRSTRKEWSKQRFKFPYWAPKGGHTFIAAMNRMGFKLSLWLCCAYDLFRYEEQCYAGTARKLGVKPDIPENIAEIWEDDRITGKVKDPRLKKKGVINELKAREAEFDEGDMPWFEHLKKFVEQGAQCFKLDGAYQVTDWNGVPNRKWSNGASNEEMHNLYPLVYGKQMARGYEEYTGKRSMVYSAGGYAGIQQFVATWAGDTGGGAKPCASLLNLGMSGHANQSCDMGIFDPRSLHFGMLQTWSQQNNWCYWFQPWYQTDERLGYFRDYLKLRYRLMPYIYTAAAEANRTGWPVMRSLPFVYPDRPEYDMCKTTYMFGPSLLVGAFTDTLDVPPGDWYEWRSDRKTTGPCKVPVTVTPDWGGALYVKAGSVVPTWPAVSCLNSGWNASLILEAYTGADGESELYEDDGTTLKYKSGLSARIPLSLSGRDGAVRLVMGARKGVFGGAYAVRDVTVRFHGLEKKPASAKVAGKETAGVWCEKSRIYSVGPVKVGSGGATFEIK